MIGLLGRSRWVVGSAIAIVSGCAPAPLLPPAAGGLTGDLACAAEAEQLREPVVAHASPSSDAAPLAELEAGRFVYRCERSGDWLAIMFPAREEAIDCTRRPAGEACSIGWVRGNVQTAIFG